MDKYSDCDEDSSGSGSGGEGGAYPPYAMPPLMIPSTEQGRGLYPPHQPPPAPFYSVKTGQVREQQPHYYSDMESSSDEDVGGHAGGGDSIRHGLDMDAFQHQKSLKAPNGGNGEKDSYYSDMDNSNNESDGSDGFDLTVNYAEMFPIAESEQRATQIVANRRLEKDKSELIGGRNQDYLGLAREYKFHRKFSDPRSNPACVLCHSRSSKDVFFPCEHRCVCRECIRKENFCDERELQNRKDGYSLCPLCANAIKIIIPFDHGREVAKYWAWVEEVVPPLPPGFQRKFVRSAEVLHDIYVEKTHHDIIEDTMCKQS